MNNVKQDIEFFSFEGLENEDKNHVVNILSNIHCQGLQLPWDPSQYRCITACQTVLQNTEDYRQNQIPNVDNNPSVTEGQGDWTNQTTYSQTPQSSDFSGSKEGGYVVRQGFQPESEGIQPQPVLANVDNASNRDTMVYYGHSNVQVQSPDSTSSFNENKSNEIRESVPAQMVNTAPPAQTNTQNPPDNTQRPESSSSPPLQGEVLMQTETKADMTPQTKTYERRNKKRRPPGYYDNLDIAVSNAGSKPSEISSESVVSNSSVVPTVTDKINPAPSMPLNVPVDQDMNNGQSRSPQVMGAVSEDWSVETKHNDSGLSNATDNITKVNDVCPVSEISHSVKHDNEYSNSVQSDTKYGTDTQLLSDTCQNTSAKIGSSLENEPAMKQSSPQPSQVPIVSSTTHALPEMPSESLSSQMDLQFLGESDAQIESSPTQAICDTSSKPKDTLVSPETSDNTNVCQPTSASHGNTTPKPAAAAPSAWNKPKPAWADLFKSSTAKPSTPSVVSSTQADAGNAATDNEEARQAEEDKQPKKAVPVSEDKNAKELGEILLNNRVHHKTVSLQPRGLINRSNWCYVNATLQALLACPPFYHLMKSLPAYPALSRGPSSTPVIDALVEFLGEFSVMQIKASERQAMKANGRYEIPTGSSFEPIYVYKMLQAIQYQAAFKHGRQEDAEEFLSCVFNGLHDEMVAAMGTVNGTKDSRSPPRDDQPPSVNGDVYTEASSYDGDAEEDDDNWEQVGPKKKSVVTRSASFTRSPISEIFGGQLRSILHQHGSKESATLEPFFTLQLDIQSDKVWNLRDALERLVSKESLQGYTDSKTKVEVEATRRQSLEELPPVLILHLKCFVYDMHGGCQKAIKKIDFEANLEISKDLLSPNVKSKIPASMRTYKLFAVVNHHGERAVGGHYTTDLFHPGINGWVRADDSSIKVVHQTQVLKYVPPKMPYLLYYRRLDLL